MPKVNLGELFNEVQISNENEPKKLQNKVKNNRVDVAILKKKNHKKAKRSPIKTDIQYQPTSDAMRTAIFLLKGKSFRGNNEQAKTELKTIIENLNF